MSLAGKRDWARFSDRGKSSQNNVCQATLEPIPGAKKPPLSHYPDPWLAAEIFHGQSTSSSARISP